MIQVVQPSPILVQPSPIGDWRYGLFDCFGSIPDCLGSYCCPSCYAGYAAHEVGEGIISSLIQCCCYPLGLLWLRPMVRGDLGIQGSIIKDLLVTCCCPCCAYVQLKREVVD